MFIKLTKTEDYDFPEDISHVYINASKVKRVEPRYDGTYIYGCGTFDSMYRGFTVKEKVETVVMLLEEALKGGNK